MNEPAPDLTQHVLHPAMHEKLLLRAAELVAMGWTRGTAARDAPRQKVRSTAPQATTWCVVGAVDRALYELWSLDVYALLGLEVDAYDTAPCPLELLRALRRPLQRVLGRHGLAQEAKEQLSDVPFDPPSAPVPETLSETLNWLVIAYPDDFAPSEPTHTKDGKAVVVIVTPVYAQQLTAAIDEHLNRLQALRCKMACSEEQETEAKIDAAALPVAVLDQNVGQYAARNDRELDRALKRLQTLQAARRASGRVWPRVTS